MSLRTTHILAVVGAVVVFVATAVTWYTHDVSVSAQTGQVAYSSSKSYTLWDLTTLAPCPPRHSCVPPHWRRAGGRRLCRRRDRR